MSRKGEIVPGILNRYKNTGTAFSRKRRREKTTRREEKRERNEGCANADRGTLESFPCKIGTISPEIRGFWKLQV